VYLYGQLRWPLAACPTACPSPTPGLCP
jgi:hypothetical protein